MLPSRAPKRIQQYERLVESVEPTLLRVETRMVGRYRICSKACARPFFSFHHSRCSDVVVSVESIGQMARRV